MSFRRLIVVAETRVSLAGKHFDVRLWIKKEPISELPPFTPLLEKCYERLYLAERQTLDPKKVAAEFLDLTGIAAVEVIVKHGPFAGCGIVEYTEWP